MHKGEHHEGNCFMGTVGVVDAHYRLRFAMKTKDVRRRLWRWLTTWTWEKVGKTLAVLFVLALAVFFIAYREILTWIWCNIFQRCVNGVAF